MWVTSEGGSCCKSYTLWKKDLNGLILNSQYIKEWAIERKRNGQPINACFCSYHSCFSISCGFLCSSFLPSLFTLFSLLSFYLSIFYFLSPPPPFLHARLWPFILPAVTGFTIFTQPLLACCGCPSKSDHWSTGYLTTTTTLCWLHASFPDKSGFVLSLISLNTLIQIRVKPLPYQPLQHASSGSNSCLLLLGDMSPQQDISPKRA